MKLGQICIIYRQKNMHGKILLDMLDIIWLVGFIMISVMTSIMQMYSLHNVKLFYVLTMTLPFNPARSKDLFALHFVYYVQV